jgi:hypothetical protein
MEASMRGIFRWFLMAAMAAACIPDLSVVAQQQPPASAQQPPFERPLAGPEYVRLGFFLGTWEEEVTHAGSEGTAPTIGRGRWMARPFLGHFLMFNYEGRGPEGPYRAQGVLTFDRDAQLFRMWWFDDGGGIGDYRGNFTDANTLVLEHQAKKEGRDFRERITYVRVAPGSVRTKIEQAWDSGEFKTVLEASARRGAAGMGRGPVPPAPPPK